MHVGVAGKEQEYQVVFLIFPVPRKYHCRRMSGKEADERIQELPNDKGHPDQRKKYCLRQDSG